MPYNPFQSLQFIPNFNTGHLVGWLLDPAFKYVTPYSFIFEASQVPTFTELYFSKDVGTALMAVDDSKLKQTWDDDFFYRVILNNGDGKKYISPNLLFGAALENKKKYCIAAEIVRKELLRMVKFTGQQAWVLKRKLVSTKKFAVVDEISGVPIADEPTDYGTGEDGGYHTPLGIYYSIEDGSQKKNLNEEGFGVNDLYEYKIRTIGFPPLDVRDIIVDVSSDTRFNILDVQNSYMPGTNIAIIQEITARLVPNTDPIYRVEVPRNYEFFTDRLYKCE